VTSDGLLGAVRQVPLAEINAILAPPPENEESASADGDSTSDEEEGEASADEGDDGDESEAEAEAEAEVEANTESETEANAETEPESQEASATPSESKGEEESSFDSALTASVSSSESESDVAITGLGDMTMQGADDAAAAAPEMAVADAVDTEAAVEIDITDSVVASVVDSLAEDEQKERAEEVIAAIIAPGPDTPPDLNISLELESTETLTTNPFFSSNANLLVRSTNYFQQDAPAQFNVTHALLREKFPDSFDENGIVNHTERQSSDIDLSSYDAIFVYLGADDGDHNFTPAEVAAYRDFIHDDGKKVLTIGRQEQNMGTINSAMPIYHNNTDGYQYTGYTSSDNQTQLLSPVDGNSSELLFGVTSFENYNDSNLFQRVDFRRDLVADNSDSEISVDNGLLTNSFGDYPALDFGNKGAVFFGRWVCGGNESMNGYLGASIDANFVDNGREQICRNLISSIAPEDSLVDVEVGRLSVSGDAETASFRIIDGGDDNFKIIGDKLVLDKNANLTAGAYGLTIGVTAPGENEVQRLISVAVAEGVAERRIIATRDSYHVGDTISFATENLVSDTDYLDDISWVSIDAGSNGGQPTNTGIITLHYRVTENGSTFDRFHEIEITHDCTSDHCDAFATSMDTERDLTFDRDFDVDNRSSWASFFDRFDTGTVRLAKAYSFTSSDAYEGGGEPYLDVLNAEYSHNLAVNFGTESGELNTAGTFDGIVDGTDSAADFNVTWNFSFTDANGPCDAAGLCYLPVAEAESISELRNLQTADMGSESISNLPGVGLMNMALPNGKHSMLVRSNLASEHASGCDSSSQCRLHETDYQPMTPQ
jgi:hypothetical protein